MIAPRVEKGPWYQERDAYIHLAVLETSTMEAVMLTVFRRNWFG